MKKYYQILGLQPGASKDQIKRAYRKMAMRYHPDRNPHGDAGEKFLEVLEAYEYLTGIRKMKKPRDMSMEDIQRFRDLMQKVAEEKAREQYKQRVRQFRKMQEREQALEYQRGIFLLIGIIVLAVAVWQGFDFYKNLVINRDAKRVEAQVSGIAIKRMIYKFPVDDSVVEDRVYVRDYGMEMLAGNGMPLKIGDKFELVYSKSRPDFHRINYEKVSTATMQRYFELVSSKLQLIYAAEWQGLSNQDKYIKSYCMSMLIFNKYGFDGLSTVYHYDGNFLENFSHNSWHWYFMKNSEDFQAIYMACGPEAG